MIFLKTLEKYKGSEKPDKKALCTAQGAYNAQRDIRYGKFVTSGRYPCNTVTVQRLSRFVTHRFTDAFRMLRSSLPKPSHWPPGETRAEMRSPPAS